MVSDVENLFMYLLAICMFFLGGECLLEENDVLCFHCHLFQDFFFFYFYVFDLLVVQECCLVPT